MRYQITVTGQIDSNLDSGAVAREAVSTLEHADPHVVSGSVQVTDIQPVAEPAAPSAVDRLEAEINDLSHVERMQLAERFGV